MEVNLRPSVRTPRKCDEMKAHFKPGFGDKGWKCFNWCIFEQPDYHSISAVCQIKTPQMKAKSILNLAWKSLLLRAAVSIR